MAGLLQKVLKALVLRASSLPAAVQVAAGLKGAAEEALGGFLVALHLGAPLPAHLPMLPGELLCGRGPA